MQLLIRTFKKILIFICGIVSNIEGTNVSIIDTAFGHCRVSRDLPVSE